MMKALIQEGVVVGLASGDALGIPLPGGVPVWIGWRYDGDEFTPPVVEQPSPRDVANTERAWRDAELGALVWLRDRHRDQLEIGAEPTLTAAQFTELLIFMQALRDWPQADAFPDFAARPIAPAWIESVM
ncbi:MULTISPECIES: phage tail assembly chaperone [unclassified Pseudomonas]|uniref:phage tail assembly chaperone n=1 Tax=unclassified Pseudomonas TaxID=196821 RepID=UPI000AAEC7C9|nr:MULTISPECIES: phage tail assembly chaperone [unclassified Pseudomonas]